MKYTTLQDLSYDDKKNWLKITDLENIFHVYSDSRGNNYYNLNMSLYVNVPLEYILLYTCKTDASWTLLSYLLYKTTRLAWLLMKLNNVKPKDMFLLKHSGDVIRYVLKSDVETIVANMNNVET